MKILAFAGSIRQDSFNKRLLGLVAASIKKQGAEITVVDLKDFDMPMYNGDSEQTAGVPAKGSELKKMLRAHDMLLIASPEYNGFFTPLVKNTLDWMTRAEGDEKACEVLKGKAVAIISASPGGYGGSRSVGSLRTLLTNIGAVVREESYSVPKAHEALATPDGELLASIDKYAALLLQPEVAAAT